MAKDTGRKLGYVRGLIDSLPIGENDPQRKIYDGLIDVLTDLIDAADETNDVLADLNAYVESIDDDLSRMEEDHGFHSGDDEEEEMLEDFFANGGEIFPGTKSNQLSFLNDDDDEDDEEYDFTDDDFLDPVVCPECKKPFLVQITPFEEDDEESFICPHCGKEVVPEEPSRENMLVGRRPQED